MKGGKEKEGGMKDGMKEVHEEGIMETERKERIRK